MFSIRQGSLHLARVAGIDLFLHWSWFFVAVIEIESRGTQYSSVAWNVLEYLALFLIVLLHEFGHALACRQVGGTANRIMLWPLGGVAYVDPPPRPGATLWSLAAGPLVNVALLPVLIAVYIAARALGWHSTMPDEYAFVRAVLEIDAGLLVFNMLPVYPLDGGQILRSLLWFVMGRARSLMVAAALGFVGVVGLAVLAVATRSVWTGLIALYLLTSCWQGWKAARNLYALEKLPRRSGFACPVCHAAPLLGERWKCDQCGGRFDTFEHGARCPHCGVQHPSTMCADCGRMTAIADWHAAAPWTSAAGLTRGLGTEKL
jgi:Zn-dependent protease